MQHDLLTPSVGRGGLRAKYLLSCCCIRDSLSFDLQQDHVLKKLNFDLQGWGGGGGGGSEHGHIVCQESTQQQTCDDAVNSLLSLLVPVLVLAVFVLISS